MRSSRVSCDECGWEGNERDSMTSHGVLCFLRGVLVWSLWRSGMQRTAILAYTVPFLLGSFTSFKGVPGSEVRFVLFVLSCFGFDLSMILFGLVWYGSS